MCRIAAPSYGFPSYLKAEHYFAKAKKRNAELKKLKSVSREFRRQAIREIKRKAYDELHR